MDRLRRSMNKQSYYHNFVLSQNIIQVGNMLAPEDYRLHL